MTSIRIYRCIRFMLLFVSIFVFIVMLIPRKHLTKLENQHIYDPYQLSTMIRNQPEIKIIQESTTKSCNNCQSYIGVQNIYNRQLEKKETSTENKEFERKIFSKLNMAASLQNKTYPVLVIILAYMHTGSSYTARILQQHRGSFYEFEPLRSLQESSRRSVPICFLNGTCSNVSGEVIEAGIGTEAVRNTITCNHDKLDIATLSTPYLGFMSSDNRDTADFLLCQKKKHNRQTTYYGSDQNEFKHYIWKRNRLNSRKCMLSTFPHNNRTTKLYQIQRRATIINDLRASKTKPIRNTYMKHTKCYSEVPLLDLIENIKSCLPYLINKCMGASIRVSKYIRLTMEMVENILPDFGNLRVIHLLRDPRAMMDSQLRKNDMNVKSLPMFVKRTQYMCRRMKDDLDISKRLRKIYPDQIYILRYEDLASNPTDIGKKLFKFIGVPFSFNDGEYIFSTSLKPEKDSKYRAAVWRSHITSTHLQIVNNYCQKLYKELNYRQFSSILDVRNLSTPYHFVGIPNISAT